MRMTDLIEACEAEFENELDEGELDGPSTRVRRAAKTYAKSDAGKLSVALKVANQNPKKPCPDGFRRNAQGKCQSIHSLERESAERTTKAIQQYKAMPMGGGAKKPSLVDRMKSLFGKK